MVKSKGASKKQQKRGVDFKKIKRKLGRKLPPARNATNTEVKSKAIILPEQSVASEKAGLAVSKKGLTLRELLQQTAHHNSKVRRDALLGIKDLFLKHPEELRLHRYAAVEKLRERISDDDKLVRETLYQLFKSVVFPGSNEANQGLLISLMMAYIFNAMTNLAIDVRFMAFKFLDLVVEFYPTSFSLYAAKILQNYEDILRKSQFYLEDKGKLKSTLTGLIRCLSLISRDEGEANKIFHGERMLQAFEPDEPRKVHGGSNIVNKLKELVLIVLNCFQEFVPLVNPALHLDAQSFDCIFSILRTIDLATMFLISEIKNSKTEAEASQGDTEVTVLDQAFASALLKKLFGVFPFNRRHSLSMKEDDRYFVLNTMITEIFFHLHEWIRPSPVLLDAFLEFTENALFGKVCSQARSGKALREKHLSSLLPFIPKLVLQLPTDRQTHLLEAFTQTFKDCNPESSLKLACLSTIEEMLIPSGSISHTHGNNLVMLDNQIIWIRELPSLLIILGSQHQSISKVVLRLLLRLGQIAYSNSALAWEYESSQEMFSGFFSKSQGGGVLYGPFSSLPSDAQEIAICCLYYFSNLNPLLLKSVASCCLYSTDIKLTPILFRIIEVLHSSFRAGHIQVADYVSFVVTLLSRYRVLPAVSHDEMILGACGYMSSELPFNRENVPYVTSLLKWSFLDRQDLNTYVWGPPSGTCVEDAGYGNERDLKISNYQTFKSISGVVSSYLSQIGDSFLVFQIVEKVVLGQFLSPLPIDNARAVLQLLITVDSKPSRLSEQSIYVLANFLPWYLIGVVQNTAERAEMVATLSGSNMYLYYIVPCLLLFDRSKELLKHALTAMAALLSGSASSTSSHACTFDTISRFEQINAIIYVLIWMHKEVKFQKIISLFRRENEYIIECVGSLESLIGGMSIEERCKLQSSVDQLKVVLNSVPLG